jgi:hypothetical protein
VVVRGGSICGGSTTALLAIAGGRVVAEGAVLEARAVQGDEGPTSAARTEDFGSSVVLRRCELRLPPPAALPQLQPAGSVMHNILQVEGGARATAADCACSGQAVVLGRGSALLHMGLAFPPGLVDPIFTGDGGVARELPAAAGGPGGSRAGAPAPAAPQ